MTFRDAQLACPACARVLIPQPGGPSRLWCEDCRGLLVPTTEVEALISDFKHAPFTLPAGTPGERQCPRCVAKFVRFRLFGIELDRCAAHGVWFDRREFVHVLEASTGVDPRTIEDESPPERNLLRRVLDALFVDARPYKRPREDE